MRRRRKWRPDQTGNLSARVVPELRAVSSALRLTRLGMIAERVLRCFWPFFTILMLAMAALMFGLQDNVGVETAWAGLVISTLGGFGTLIRGLFRFRFPTAQEVQARLDETLPERPIAAITDRQAIGATDAASRAIWAAHRKRMQEAAANAKPAKPDLRLADRDPYALRFVAMLAFVMALLFGSVWQVASVRELGPGSAAAAIPTGPSWEGWVEPPTYTGLPSLYLNDQTDGAFSAPVGSQISIRLYGEIGALHVNQTISDTREGAATDQVQDFTVTQSGRLEIAGEGGAEWAVTAIEDELPLIEFSGEMEVQASGIMEQDFEAWDDYGVISASATITLDLGAVDRRFGLAVDPDPREAIIVDLPMTIAGDRADFTETLVEDFSQHPWANLPVTFRLHATDAAGQEGQSPYDLEVPLPGRRFFDPLARSVVEVRRDILWARSNAGRAALILRTVTHRPDDIFNDSSAYLMLRVAMRRLEAANVDGLDAEEQAEIAEALWQVALLLEDGSLSDALERMRRARDRLSQAMRDGASDEEIAELMQDYRDAMEDYMRQLAQNPEDSTDQPNDGQSQQMSQQDLQDMMDRIEELMQQGRMAEAQELLDQLQQMMENMRVTEGGQQQGQSPGEQAMEGLSDTLREQQGLSDEAFRDLQEQFNPDAQAGESGENVGRSGGEGQGQSHQGQGGEGEGEDRDGEGGSSGGAGQQGTGSLAERQQALRDELRRQQEALPGEGTPEGDAAREALERAGRAMENAENALRQDDLPEALDNQADAMEALREGMRQLGEAMAEQNRQNQGEEGDAEAEARRMTRDPLGRSPGADGLAGTDENLLQGEDVYRRAKEILDELRNRSSDQSRPEKELNYLERLLDRF